MNSAQLGQQLAIDVNALAQTRQLAKDNPRAAMKEAARQFEAVFLQMVLKAMREATPREGLFDSEQTRLYESLLDQQLSQTLSANGRSGLAALIEQQLALGMDAGQAPAPAMMDERAAERGASTTASAPATERFARHAPAGGEQAGATSVASGDRSGHARDTAGAFVDRLWSHAGEASRATGIPAHFMIAHAALETGWGRAELRFTDGRPTHNLFGIKAGRNWSGAVAEAITTEYVDGVAQKRVERFRAYPSYAAAFRDYAQLLAANPRYAEVLNQKDAAGFARGLQNAGYATDPMYAAKLERIIGGETLRAGLIG